MKPKSFLPCVLSLVFGAASYPLSIITFFMFYAASYENYYNSYSVGAIVFSVIVILLCVVVVSFVVAGIVLGIIGIKQRRPKRGMAIAGIIISSLIIIAYICQYGCMYYIMPNISVMLSDG